MDATTETTALLEKKTHEAARAQEDMVECGECWRTVPRAETVTVRMGNYGSWPMCRVCQMHEALGGG